VYNLHKQLWGYKVEEKLRLGVRELKWLNIAGLDGLSQSSFGNWPKI
jgi:hypothetical protein